MSMRRRLYLRPHGVCLGFWLYKGYQAGRERSKAIDFYAFSRGSFRKPARNLIARAQRKSQVCWRLQDECLGNPRVSGETPGLLLVAVAVDRGDSGGHGRLEHRGGDERREGRVSTHNAYQ